MTRRRATLPTHPTRLILLALAIAIGLRIAPTAFWLYHTERAGRLMDRALIKPDPTQIDQLAAPGDRPILDDARAQLGAALRWRPGDAHAYRMLGQVEAARRDWLAAAAAYDQARSLAPGDPLIRWEAALVEAGLWRASAPLKRTVVLPGLAPAAISAPEDPITTPYCQPGQPLSCYVAATAVAQPLAAAAGSAYTATAIFLHAPASLGFSLPITSGQNALIFLLGLDPRARDWNTDGVTYEIWAGAAQQPLERIYARTLGPADLNAGWTADWADLRRWSGRSVNIYLKTAAGPAGDTSGDWALWGDLTLADADHAPALARYPRLRMEAAFARSGYDAAPLRERADQLFRQGDWDGAEQLYLRALAVPNQPATVRFRAVLAGAMLGRPPRDLQNELGLPTHPITATTLIEGESMHWLQSSNPAVADGAPLGVSYQADTRVGPLWWSGAAVAIIEVAGPGAATVTVRAIASPGAAARLALEIDGAPSGTLETTRDGSFSEHSFPIELAAGTHVVAVRFLNNGAIDGVDNNGFVDWLRIAR